MTFRTATKKDATNIAALHTLSWQTTYINVFSEDYLEKEIAQERLEYWQNKIENVDNQWILLAEKGDDLIGFVCMIGSEDENYGSLIDNLHVRPDLKGQGLGKQLLQKGIEWAQENFPEGGQYLWVYKVNHSAIGFYEKMGGLCAELEMTENPDGGRAEVWRVVWVKRRHSFKEKLKRAFS
ncbi:MAG: GNAT superfamily N-acetyltransferase [Saprospiraceae bacterium]|jgi:GNAT superfamily N-acetyltransferase